MSSQKLEVLEIIKPYPLILENFEWSEVESENFPDLVVSSFKYSDSEYYFVFDFYENKRYCYYSPGEEKGLMFAYPSNWYDLKVHVSKWVKYLSREINSPDLWREIRNAKKVREDSIKIDTDATFTDNEIENLKSKLNEIEQYIIDTQDMIKDQSEYLKHKIEYLEKALNRLGKRDWFEVARSTIIDIIMKLNLSVEQIGTFYRFLASTLGEHVSSLPPLP